MTAAVGREERVASSDRGSRPAPSTLGGRRLSEPGSWWVVRSWSRFPSPLLLPPTPLGGEGGKNTTTHHDPNPTFWAFSRVVVPAQPAIVVGRGSWWVVVEDRPSWSLRGHGSACGRGGSWSKTDFSGRFGHARKYSGIRPGKYLGVGLLPGKIFRAAVWGIFAVLKIIRRIIFQNICYLLQGGGEVFANNLPFVCCKRDEESVSGQNLRRP